MSNLTATAMLSVLPEVLRNDEKMMALATAIADILEDRMSEISQTEIYENIMSLPDALLNILAYDFKVDWWDANYTLEEKRRTLADSWKVHRVMGTTSAVTNSIHAIYPGAKVTEWFEYSGNPGKPYHFRLDVGSEGGLTDTEKLVGVLERIAFYKPLRSYCDGVYFSLTRSTKIYIGMAIDTSDLVTYQVSGIEDMPTVLSDENNRFLYDEVGCVFEEEVS